MDNVDISRSCLGGKQNVDILFFRQAAAMPEQLKNLLIRRLKAEMEARELSDNELSRLATKKGYKLAQNTISLIKRGKMNPSVDKLEALAAGLDVPAWLLLAEGVAVEHKVIKPLVAEHKKVLELPPPYPKIFRDKPQDFHKSPQQKRKKRVR